MSPRSKAKSPLRKRSAISFAPSPQPVIEPLVLRPAAAAKLMSVSVRTVWTWMERGQVVVVRVPGGNTTLITMASLKKLIEPPAGE
jgi:hypothetical protein